MAHLGQCSFKVLLLDVKAADLVLGKVQRIGRTKDSHRAVFFQHR